VTTLLDRGGHFHPVFVSSGTQFATTSIDMNRDQAQWLANSVIQTMVRPCYPAERNFDELGQLLAQILASVKRGEITDEDAKTIITSIIATDVERRVETILSQAMESWARSASQMYTVPPSGQPQYSISIP